MKKIIIGFVCIMLAGCSQKIDGIKILEKELNLHLPKGYVISQNKVSESYRPDISIINVKLNFNAEHLQIVHDQIINSKFFAKNVKNCCTDSVFLEFKKQFQDNGEFVGMWIENSENEYQYVQVLDCMDEGTCRAAELKINERTLTFHQWAHP